MLREDIVEAAAGGRFYVYAVASVDDALGLLTNMAAGSSGEWRESFRARSASSPMSR